VHVRQLGYVFGVLFWWGCAGPKGGEGTPVQVLIDADVGLRSEIDRIELNDLRVTPAPGKNGAGRAGWPLWVLARTDQGRARVALVAKAFHGKTELVRRTVDLTLDATGQRRGLTIYFSEVCRSAFKGCDARDEGTCLPCESQCGSTAVDESSLPRVDDPEAPFSALRVPECEPSRLDGGLDGQVTDANAQTFPEAGIDAGEPTPGMDGQVNPGSGDSGPDGSAEAGAAGVAAEPIAVGARHACAIRGAERTVYCWGANDQGQLGVSGELSDWRVPVQVNRDDGPLVGVQKLALGTAFSCALVDGGRVLCWGARDLRQTGTRRTGLVYRPYPVVLAAGGNAPDYLPLENIVELAAGQAHACAVNENGGVFCWGNNLDRQLGVELTETYSNGAVPVSLPDGQLAKLVGAASDASCVVSTEDRLYCWGDNRAGTAGVAPEGTANEIVPLPQEVLLDSEAKPVIRLRGGNRHMLALAQNGSVWTWGSAAYGQLFRVTPACDSPVAGNKCDPVPGAVSFLGAETASDVGTTADLACPVLGPKRKVFVGSPGYVTISEGDASVPLEDVETAAGATSGAVGCAQTASRDVYCFGAFQQLAGTKLEISEIGKAVKWSFPP